MKTQYRLAFLCLIGTGLFGCLQGGDGAKINGDVNASPTASEQGINNSDPSKKNFHERTVGEERYYQKKLEMLGKIYAEPTPLTASSKSTAAAATGTVGFLVDNAWGNTSNGHLEIFMDTENDGNGDFLNYYGGTTNLTQIPGIRRESGNHGGVRFHFVKRTLTSLPRMEWDYVVPLFSDQCPLNGTRFGEVFDNEDTDNQDFATSSVYPGWSRRDWTGTRLEFCFVLGDGNHNPNKQPPWGHGEGAFTNKNKINAYGTCNTWYEALLDGEDDGFAGSIDYEGLTSQERVDLLTMPFEIKYGAPHFFINSCP